MSRNIFGKSRFFVLSGLLILVVCFLLINTNQKASAAGEPSTILPIDDSWLVVAQPGGNGMNSPNQSVVIYIPSTQISVTHRLTIENGCNDYLNLDKGGGYETFYAVGNAVITAAGNSNVNLSSNRAFCNYEGANKNMSFNFNIDTSATGVPRVLINTVTYYKYVVGAAIENPTGSFYENYFKFRLDLPNGTTDGSYVAYSERLSADPPVPYDSRFYTGLGNPQSALATWSTTVKFSIPCLDPNDYSNMNVYFYDSDRIALFQPGAITYTIKRILKSNGVRSDVTPVALVNRPLNGGNNVEDVTAPFSMDKLYYYEIVIDNIGKANTLQVAVPGSQMWALDNTNCGEPVAGIDSCKLENGNTIFYGWGYDNDSGSEPTVAVDIYNVASNGSTTHSSQGQATIGGYRSNDINNAINTSGPARDDAYGFRISISGLTRGNNYYVDGNVRDHPSGSWSQIGINNFNQPVADVSGGLIFSGGNIRPGVDGVKPRIPDACLRNPNTAPGGIFDAQCNVPTGSLTGNIQVWYFVWDADGEVVTSRMSIDGAERTNQQRTTPAGSGSVRGDFALVSVARRTAQYAITVTVTDGAGASNNLSYQGPPVSLTRYVSCGLPAPPTVTVIGGANCTNNTISFRISASEAGFTYSAGLMEGSPTATPVGAPDIKTGLGTGDYSGANGFSVTGWRDTVSHRFNVVVANESFPSLADTFDTDFIVPPCIFVLCSTPTTIPASIEVGSRFSVQTSFTLSSTSVAPGVVSNVGSRIAPKAYDVTVSLNPSLVSDGTTNTGAPSGDITSTNPSLGIISADFGQYTATPTSSSAIVTANIDVAGVTTSCDTPINYGQFPYTQFFNGDVISGYGFPNPLTGDCEEQDGAGINARITTNSGGEIVGSGTQMAVFARGAVTGFRSAIVQNDPTSANISPWIRIFANNNRVAGFSTTNTNTQLGGGLNSNLCAQDWFADMPTDVQPGTTVNISDGALLGQYEEVRYNGTVRFSYGDINSEDQVFSGNKKIFVEGNIIIGGGTAGSVSYRYHGSDERTWTTVDNIPSAVFVATGNIYIDDNITRLDAILVANGTIFTCVPTFNNVFPDDTSTLEVYKFTAYRINGSCYSIPLTVNGALIANSVRLWRTGGTTNSATGFQDFGGATTAAERIRLSPEVYLSRRFGEKTTNGNPGDRRLDSLISLPPVY